MTEQQRLDSVIVELETLRQEHFRTEARLKAFFMVVLANIPKDQQAEFEQKVNVQQNRCLQTLFEIYERHDPAKAARLDTRKDRELEGL